MAGIYIHIPFCKKACVYCDFHFSTSFRYKSELIESICKELKARKSYLNTTSIETIYFGGGTPSILNEEELTSILSMIFEEFKVSPTAEITLEANPDDLDREQLLMLKRNKINRLSIGIQSFVSRDLLFMNRSHTIKQAIDSVEMAKHLGFDNITIDLIYGIPNLSQKEWKLNIHKALQLEVNHISAYCLTSEEKTQMHHEIKKGSYQLPNDATTSTQFNILIQELTQNGYEQYEISNFSRIGHRSKHNSSYWKQKHFLGVGPSAHSFNGTTRQWNVANNLKYLKGAKENEWNYEEEILDENTRYNEYIMTSLRTSWGVDIHFLEENFHERLVSHFLRESALFVNNNQLQQQDSCFVLSNKGKLLADHIASELFVVE